MKGWVGVFDPFPKMPCTGCGHSIPCKKPTNMLPCHFCSFIQFSIFLHGNGSVLSPGGDCNLKHRISLFLGTSRIFRPISASPHSFTLQLRSFPSEIDVWFFCESPRDRSNVSPFNFTQNCSTAIDALRPASDWWHITLRHPIPQPPSCFWICSFWRGFLTPHGYTRTMNDKKKEAQLLTGLRFPATYCTKGWHVSCRLP